MLRWLGPLRLAARLQQAARVVYGLRPCQQHPARFAAADSFGEVVHERLRTLPAVRHQPVCRVFRAEAFRQGFRRVSRGFTKALDDGNLVQLVQRRWHKPRVGCSRFSRALHQIER